MDINTILVIGMFLSFIALLFTGIPIAYVLGGVGILFGVIGYFSDLHLNTFTGLDLNVLGIVVSRVFSLMENWVLVALPMFIFMGLMLDRSGIAERMMLAMQQLFSGVRGGLGITVTLIGVILAASTGIIGASVVSIGLNVVAGNDATKLFKVICNRNSLRCRDSRNTDSAEHYACYYGRPVSVVCR